MRLNSGLIFPELNIGQIIKYDPKDDEKASEKIIWKRNYPESRKDEM